MLFVLVSVLLAARVLTTDGTGRATSFTIEDLLTKSFPRKVSGDGGLNPCKARISPLSSREHGYYTEKLYSISRFVDKPIVTQQHLMSKVLHNAKMSSKKRPRRAAATTLKERLWDYGVVPYEFDENFSPVRKSLAKEAMRHWENYTCLKFVERNPEEQQDYIYFTERPCGCCSFVGNRRIGAQALSVGPDCAQFGIIVHEIGHALGYYHEHTRPDRDNYVRVIKDNIIPGQESNFNKMVDQVTSLGLEYDFGSIMHYARNTYSKSKYLDTIQIIESPDAKKNPIIGQRDALSRGDVTQANILYKCPKCGQTFHTQSGMFSSTSVEEGTAKCEWRIVGTPGERIVLNIRSVDILKSDNCETDYLVVRDGYWYKSPILGTFCGRLDSAVLKSNTNRMLITYVAKNVREYKGFSASFDVYCGGELKISSEGYIESPDYPDSYRPNRNCVWKITVPDTYQVALKFLSFENEYYPNCSYVHVQVRDGLNESSPILEPVCGPIGPPHVLSSSNTMWVKFRSDRFTRSRGFSAKVVAEYDECVRTNHGCEQMCVNTLGSYHCACNPGFELHSDSKSCVDACGGLFNATTGTITSPSFPELYPSNKQCTWEVRAPPHHKVFVNFTHFDLEGNNYVQQICDYDHVSVYSKLSNGNVNEHGTFCGTKTPSLIVSDTNRLAIEFVSDDNLQQTGFAVIYYIDHDECSVQNGGCDHDCTNTLGSFYCTCRTGFVLHENGRSCKEGDCVHSISVPPYGTISSPNYPKYYPASKDCAWHISTLPGHRIRLGFMNFRLENHAECYYDFVQIFDGDSSVSRQLDTFCGSMMPYLIISSENHLYMTFRSDKSVQQKGFFATYSTICGGVLQAKKEKKKIFSHTSYGVDQYENMAKCDWVIIGGGGYSVYISFAAFDMESEDDCSYDYLEVFDGADSRGTSIGKFCGSKAPPDMTSSEDSLLVRFQTDDRNVGRGFIIEYQAVEQFSTLYSLEEYL
ncbi:protein tolkin-like [Cylas formicarius]|uniref:protein tolkin-like n=1 Tax=Cylas formicarius TaxID=197179 RepID=UPI0029586DB6|nr:protein tolkin-like [Cylas formicarius]